MRYTTTAAILAALSVSGCAGLDRQRCTEYGYEPGTPDFAGCMEDRSARRSAGLITLGGAMMRSQPAPVYQPSAPMSMPTPTTTRCRDVGYGNVDCTTW